MPDWIEPMAATLTQERAVGDDWLFERKFDGIRLLAYKRGAEVRLYSRNRLEQALPLLAEGRCGAPCAGRNPRWRADMGSGRVSRLRHLVVGRAGSHCGPIEERRAALGRLPFAGPIERVELVVASDPWELARREGWEGVIAKRRGSPYEPRRSKHWLKMKCESSQEFVVGGFTDPQGSRVGLGALLVGYYAGEDLVFAGKLGTGFDTRLLLDLRSRLDASRSHSPHSRARRACRECARTGSARKLSCRPRFSNGQRTESCATRAFWASVGTRPRATSAGSRDHSSGQAPLS
jgi:bifunctional non-homologous end joining protein LigD